MCLQMYKDQHSNVICTKKLHNITQQLRIWQSCASVAIVCSRLALGAFTRTTTAGKVQKVENYHGEMVMRYSWGIFNMKQFPGAREVELGKVSYMENTGSLESPN